MIDISDSLKNQQEHVEYWISYLKSHLDSEELSIIVVGNQIDKIKDSQINGISNYLSGLKGTLIYDSVLLSAKKVSNIDTLISILQQKCNTMDKNKFMIPKLYKITAESLQREDVPFLIGNQRLQCN